MIRLTAAEYRGITGGQKRSPQKQLQGSRNRSAGKQFEQFICAACNYYREQKIADIEKTPEPMRIIMPAENGRYIACFEKKAQPDYKGTLAGGRSIVFEAKHTSSGRLEQKRVTKEQSAALDSHFEMGAKCFVAAGFGMSSFFRIPWAVWRDMKTVFGRMYVCTEDLERYKIKMDFRGLMFLPDLDVP